MIAAAAAEPLLKVTAEPAPTVVAVAVKELANAASTALAEPAYDDFTALCTIVG